MRWTLRSTLDEEKLPRPSLDLPEVGKAAETAAIDVRISTAANQPNAECA